MTQQWWGRRFTALLVVVALHALFLLLLSSREPLTRRVAHGGPSSVLFFVEAPRPAVTIVGSVPSRATQPRPTAVDEPATTAETSVAAPEQNPPATIDWAAQAAQSAATVVDKAIREETRKCDPSNQPNSFLPPCNPRTNEFEWKREPPRVGFAGGLPYVRIGKRCAVGLGFFGCAIGPLPAANGDLFEGMDDPERDRSSVPATHPPGIRQ